GDPAFPVRSDTGYAVILSAAPGGVRIPQPEGRGKGAGRQVNVDIRLLLADFADQVDHRIQVAIERASREDRVRVAGSIKFELIHTVFVNHLHTDLTKARVVFRSGWRESVVDDLDALSSSVLGAVFGE